MRCSRISSSFGARLLDLGVRAADVRLRAVAPVAVRPDDDVRDQRVARLDPAVGRDPDRAAHLAGVRTREHVGEELDRLAVRDLRRRQSRREDASISVSAARRPRATALLAEPAELVRVDDPRQLVVVLHAGAGARARGLAGDELGPAGGAASRSRMGPRPSAIPTRPEPGERRHRGDVIGEDRERVQLDAEAALAEAVDVVASPRRSATGTSSRMTTQGPLAVASRDDARRAAVVPPVAADVVHLVGAEGNDCSRRPAPSITAAGARVGEVAARPRCDRRARGSASAGASTLLDRSRHRAKV